MYRVGEALYASKDYLSARTKYLPDVLSIGLGGGSLVADGVDLVLPAAHEQVGGVGLDVTPDRCGGFDRDPCRPGDLVHLP